MSATLELARSLIARPSVTPNDAGCQALIAERLAAVGFGNETLLFGEVTNLWSRLGEAAPLLTFVGHTDVVPPGPSAAWLSPPFEPAIIDGCLYGRGAADMKGSVAAFVTACERVAAEQGPPVRGSLSLLLTSDEEGPADDGTVRVVETLVGRGCIIDHCLVGEPSSSRVVGDTVKNGRRGSLNGRVTVRGVQGHVAYPQDAVNPIHRAVPAFAELAAAEWDQGNRFFPATTFQVSNIQSGTGATNVVPGDLTALFNFRYSTELTAAELQQRVSNVLDRHRLDYELEWKRPAEPFLTERGALLDAVQEAIAHHLGRPPSLSTAGGTSDGRFVAPTGAEVIELGPVNATIHQVNEHVRAEDLDALSHLYEVVVRRLLY